MVLFLSIFRTSCSESYFVSEALYVPENRLLNKQKLTLFIISVVPRQWTKLSETGQVDSHEIVPDTENSHSLERDQKGIQLLGEIPLTL